MALTPIIFAPGLMCDGALFAHQTRLFCEEPDGCTIDRHYGKLGYEQRRPTQWQMRHVKIADFSKDSTMGAMAQNVLSRVEGSFCFVGLSMGAIVGFEVWRRAPERVAGMVLMNTNPNADTPEKRANRLRQIARAQAGELTEVVMEELKPNYLADASRKDRKLTDEIAAMALRLGPDAFVRQSHALMDRADSTGTLKSITCPVEIIAGDQDILCPPSLHQEMHQNIRGSNLHILADCGHLSAMEQPEQVNQIITRLIDRIDGKLEKA